MGKLIFVDDPLYQGPPPIPQIIRRWAIQKLAASGTPIGEIARRYGLSYHRTYNEVAATYSPAAKDPAAKPPAEPTARPPRASARAARRTAAKASPDGTSVRKLGGRPITEYTAAEIATWSRKKVEDHLYVKGLDLDSAYGKRLAAALERLDPNWGT